MPPKDLLTLLSDESFLNYCFQRRAADVQYWEEYLRQQPQEQPVIERAKVLALLLAEEVGQAEVTQQYQALQAQLVARRPRRARLRVQVARRVAVWSTTALLLLGGTVSVYVHQSRQHRTAAYVSSQLPDIAPGGNSAVLTLASGQRIDLGRAALGKLVELGGMRITKASAGQLLYHLIPGPTPTTAATALNTVETPVKGQFTIVLPDGTSVWLNAQSSLSYSPTFSGSTRLVRLQGEAYFEVAHQLGKGAIQRPFVVETSLAAGDPRTQRIAVLGTHFNVNSYADEPQSTTTLLEGKVWVATLPPAGPASTARPAYVLRPGQQLRVGPRGQQLATVDTEAAVAWKNGDFVFREDLPSALRKVARWYDVEVVYTATAPQQLQIGGWISRQKNISEVLHMLEATGEVHFQLAGRRVLVSK